MKKVLIVDTSYPINSRTNKFRTSLLKEFNVQVLAWDRKGAVTSEPDGYSLFKMRSEVGNRLKKLLLFPLFVFFGIKIFLKFKPDILFVSHWDSLFLGCLMKLFNRQVKVVYDCLDTPAASNRFIQKSLIRLEHFCLRFTDLTIFASRYFPELYSKDLRSVVFENYPSKSLLETKHDEPDWYQSVLKLKNSGLPVVAWVGVVRYPSVLEKLIESFCDLEMQLFIFGDGPSLNFAENLVKKKGLTEKVYFGGRYSQNDLPYIYEVSDFIWAAYPTDNLNAVYAISNKFFECSMFQRIPIISSRTKMAADLEVEYSRNVILVEEFNVEDIKAKLISAANGSFSFKQYQKIEYWEERSADLLDLLRKL